MTPRVKRYAEEIAAEHDVSVRAILSFDRTGSLWRARRAVWRRLRDDGFSSAQIGAWFNRDGSTVRATLSRKRA